MPTLKPMCERTFEFRRAVIAEFRRHAPADQAERILWDELLKTQKSLAANTAESDGAHTRPDFILKFQISLKEAREAFQLLRLIDSASPHRRQHLDTLRHQCGEIIAILVTSLKTAKRRHEEEQRQKRRRN